METCVLYFIDWLELRLDGSPDVTKLKQLGYNPIFDKGSRSHFHKFETDEFVIMWGIRSPYIKHVYTHYQKKNNALYSKENFFACSIDDMCYKDVASCGLTLDGAFVSRIDFAIDMEKDSSVYQNVCTKFLGLEIGVGKEVLRNYRTYINDGEMNYSAGNRGCQFYLRFYNKTLENIDYKTKQPAKDYIKELHDLNFGEGVQVYRFECEWKPKKGALSKFSDFLQYFDYFAQRFLGEESAPRKVYLGDGYEKTLNHFTKKDAVQLLKLMNKYELYRNNRKLFGKVVRKHLNKIVKGE